MAAKGTLSRRSESHGDQLKVSSDVDRTGHREEKSGCYLGWLHRV